MAWQPSRIVPGLTQYLAAKGLAAMPMEQRAEATRPDAGSLLVQSDFVRIEPERPLSPQRHAVKRLKVDEHMRSQHAKSTCSPDIGCESLPASVSSGGSCAKSIDDLPPLLRDSLLPFQRDGVMFAMNGGGRVMIADDMGLGSTIPTIPSSYGFFFIVHVTHLPLQKPYKLFLSFGFCAIVGQFSSSCQQACALLGPKSWSVGYLKRFLPVPSRCGIVTLSAFPPISQCLNLTCICAALASTT
jgi:hypothetical protein